MRVFQNLASNLRRFAAAADDFRGVSGRELERRTESLGLKIHQYRISAMMRGLEPRSLEEVDVLARALGVKRVDLLSAPLLWKVTEREPVDTASSGAL